MKVKDLNSSSLKTKKLIKENFAILMHEKRSLQNITVTELVKKAGITRSSFYTHYDNIYAVAKDIQDEAMDLLIKDTKELYTTKDIYHYFDDIISHLKENESIYSMILASDEPLLFMDHLSKLINKKLNISLNTINDEKVYLNIIFFTDGCMNILIKHFRGEITISLDEINNYIKGLFSKIFK